MVDMFLDSKQVCVCVFPDVLSDNKSFPTL